MISVLLGELRDWAISWAWRGLLGVCFRWLRIWSFRVRVSAAAFFPASTPGWW